MIEDPEDFAVFLLDDDDAIVGMARLDSISDLQDLFLAELGTVPGRYISFDDGLMDRLRERDRLRREGEL